MSVRRLNLGSLAMAIGAIVGLGYGLITDSLFVLFIAVVCVCNVALLQGLALSREFGGRLDTILDETRPVPSPSNDDAGGQ